MKGRGPFLFLGLLIGFFSLAAQSLLFREHLLAYAGNEAGIAVFLSAWMVWVAVGGVLGRGFRKAEAAGENLPWLLLLYPAAFLVQLLLFWSLRPLSGVGPTEQLPMAALVGWTLTLAAPVSLVTGFLFTRVARVREAQVREGASATAARLYGAEALGGLAGGASYTAAVLAGAPVLPTALGLLLFWLLASAWFSYRSEAAAAARVHLLVAVAASAAWLAGGQAALERRRLEALPVPAGLEVLETADTPYQHVLVAAWGRTRSVFANGELSATLPGDADVTAEAALLLAEKPDAREILVLGAGAEPLVCELLRVPAVRVTHVSDDGRMAELTARHLPRELSRCLASPALRQVTSDSRRFLSQATPRFDVVVARFGEPRTAQAARFYTAEFFGLAQSALAPGGLFSVSISAPPNVLAAASLAYAAGVHKTLTGVFGQVVFTSGSRMTFLAAAEAGAVTDRPDELERRFERLRSHLPEVEPGVLATRFESARIAALEQGFSLAGSELTATDESPSVFLLNLMVEYRATRLYELFRSVRSRLLPGFLLGLACLAVALLVGRGFGLRRGEPAPGGEGRLEGTGLLALTGFSGMLGQVVLLLGYQVRFGSLLAEFGLLNALYMLGLFAGTVVAGLPRVSRVGRRCLAATSLAALALSIALVFGLVGGGLSAASEVVQRGAFFAVCLVTGCAAAGVIVAGTRLLEEGGMTVAGVAATVQAADNAGAVAGALGGGLVLLPAAGLSGCALAASALPAVPFLAMLVGSRASGPGKRPAPVPGLLLGRVLFFAWLLLGAFGWLLPALAPAPVSAPSSVAASVDLPGTGAAGASRTSEEGVVSLSSAQVAPGMAGYGGPMDVVVDLERNERIVRIRLASHRETPEYVFDIDEWMAGLVGREAPLLRYGEPGDPNGVEALTGATVTARAIVDIARTLGTFHRAARSGEAAPPDAPSGAGVAASGPAAATTSGALAAAKGSKPPGLPFWFQARQALEPHAWWLLLITGVAGIVLYLTGRWRLRLAFLVVSAGLVGVLLNRQLALDQLALLAGGALPPASHLALWVMLGLVATAPVLGAVYCGYLCPFGALTDLLSLAGLRWTVPPEPDRWLRRAKYVLAAGLALALALGAKRTLLAFDPLSFAFRLEWDALAVAILAVLLAASLVWHRPWCRYLCPLGACLSAGEGAAVAAHLVPARRTVECHLGVQVGRDWDCVRCNRCVRNVRPSARGPGRSLSPWLLAVVLAVVAGLGVARVWSRSAPSVPGFGAPALRADAPVLLPPVSEPGAEPRSAQGPAAASRPTGVGTAGTAVGSAPELAGSALAPEEPRLERKDNEPYPEQRRIDLERVREMLRDGSLSGHEAEFYLPVPADWDR